jgi:hypothetical protein
LVNTNALNKTSITKQINVQRNFNKSGYVQPAGSYNASKIINFDLPLQAVGSPASAPQFLGQIFIDSSNKIPWIGLGTSATSDWISLAKRKMANLTYNGDGTSTSKVIAHGLGTTPSAFQVLPASADAGNAGIKYVTADGTNLTVYFNNAPISGSNNVVLNWKVEAW